MKPRHLATATALTVILAAALVGCGKKGPEPLPTLTPPPTTASATVTQTPEEQAIAAAREKLDEYEELYGTAFKDPEAFTVSRFEDVAISSALNDLKNGMTYALRDHNRQIGDAVIKQVTVKDVDLTNNIKATPPDVPTVELYECYDVSKLHIVDAEGRDITPASRPATGVRLVGVSNYEYPDPDSWRVSYTQHQKGMTCPEK